MTTVIPDVGSFRKHIYRFDVFIPMKSFSIEGGADHCQTPRSETTGSVNILEHQECECSVN